MASLRPTSCCGVGEISGLLYSDPKTPFLDVLKLVLTNRSLVFKDVHSKKHNLARGAAFFTSNTEKDDNYGERFAEGILEYKLGAVHKLPSFRNPNTRNPITIYVWIVNKRALVKLCTKLGWEQGITVASGPVPRQPQMAPPQGPF